MSREMIEILILAVVAGLVIARLYSVLGKRTGSERPSAPPPRSAPATVDAGPAQPAPQSAPAAYQAQGQSAGGVSEIARLDPTFDPASFLSGARAAYEIIVQAFASGDRDTLKGLLAPRVFEAYANAIAAREQSGGQGPELVRLKNAEILDARVADEVAKVQVRFEAELAEGATGIRETNEKWTFERAVRSRDPNWLLSAVAQA